MQGENSKSARANPVHPLFAGICSAISGDAQREALRELKRIDADRVRYGKALCVATNEGDLSAEDLAAIDREFGIDSEEARRVAADLHYNALKNGGALEARRVEQAHAADVADLLRDGRLK